MDNEQTLRQFEERYKQYAAFGDRRLLWSAMEGAIEAKRFAKTNNLLMPYLHACFSVSNYALGLFEPEMGTDNAREIIALVESEEKARNFQRDFDVNFYRHTVHWISACAYDKLVEHAAMRSGFNSPVVHGAIEDGIHVCRRTDNFEYIDRFREFTSSISLASGDYEMGEHYSRLFALSQSRRNDTNRRFIGYKQLATVYTRQGKFAAAKESILAGALSVKEYHDKLQAQIEMSRYAERYCILAGKNDELAGMLKEIDCPNGMPDIPSQDENPEHYLEWTINEALKLVFRNDYKGAEKILDESERFLLSQENLARWFELRVQRIAAIMLAAEAGTPLEIVVEPLAEELRHRASKACQWSAILALDTMLARKVKLNPLGIPFPIDLGPYATKGTPVSVAQLKLSPPLSEKPGEETVQKPTVEKQEEKSPFELEAESWFASLQELWKEAAIHEHEQAEAGQSQPFPKTAELIAREHELFEKILGLTPETITGRNGEKITEDEFLTASQPLLQFRTLQNPVRIPEHWRWVKRMVDAFPDRGRSLAARAYHGFTCRNNADSTGIDPVTLGLPTKEEIERWISEAFEKKPNRTGIATIAGKIFRGHGNNREAQRYLLRATQTDRCNDFATVSLAELYEEADRPKDAIAVIELYTRAGGRHPGLLWNGTQIAFRNDMPDEFLSYYTAYTTIQPPYPMLDGQRIWALCELGRFEDALKSLDEFVKNLGIEGRDALFLRALCQAELSDDSWTKTFENATSAADTEADGVLGSALDPCGPLWNYVGKFPESDERRIVFEKFLYERGLVPMRMLSSGPDGKTATKTFGYFRCLMKQPLRPETPAFAGWVRIPANDPEYFTLWMVLANDGNEAMRLALESQARCYPIPAEPLQCERLDTYDAEKPQTVVQGKRFPPQR